MTLLETLKALHDLLSHQWTQRQYKRFNYTKGHYEYCLVGGLGHINGPNQQNAEYLIRRTILKTTNYSGPIELNDSGGQAEVLRVLEQTIKDYTNA